jgi:ribosomal protein S1
MTTTNKMDQILEENEEQIPVFNEGDMVEGKIAGRSGRLLWIDIEGRALGIVPPSEISGKKEDLAKGKKIFASVVESEDDNGNVVLSLRRADEKKAFWDLEEKYKENKPLQVKVFNANRGGLIVGTENFQGFLPVSELSREHYPRVEGGDKKKILAKLKDFVDEPLKVKVLTFDRSEDKLVFSEKEAVGSLNEDSLDEISVGDIVSAKVTGVADFGLFIQFEDNLEGLIHISEISWDRVNDIHKKYKVGDELKAKIIEIDEEKQRISLSIKRLSEDPWQKKVKKYQVGQQIKGKVNRLTPFGAFVEFDKIEGLIHISEISNKKINDPSDELELGQTVEPTIISIEEEEHKVGLSLKEPPKKEKENPEEKKKPQKTKAEINSLEKELGQATYNKLKKANIETKADLKKKTKEELEKIDGIGPKTAEKIINL